MPGIGPITKGAYAGKDTFAYTDTMVGSYDSSSATDEDATWVELERTRNWQINDGRTLTDTPFHGADRTGAIPGHAGYSGSFDYVHSYGTDAVWAFIKAAADAGTPIMLRIMDKRAITVVGATGKDVPVYIGEIQETRDGDNDVVSTVNFQFADVVDESGARIEVTDVTIS